MKHHKTKSETISLNIVHEEMYILYLRMTYTHGHTCMQIYCFLQKAKNSLCAEIICCFFLHISPDLLVIICVRRIRIIETKMILKHMKADDEIHHFCINGTRRNRYSQQTNPLQTTVLFAALSCLEFTLGTANIFETLWWLHDTWYNVKATVGFHKTIIDIRKL